MFPSIKKFHLSLQTGNDTHKEKETTMKKLVIFDLDGTLVNTIADLAQSTNHALQELGYPTHAEAEYRMMVGNGINKLFERALPEGEKTEENVLRVRQLFIPYYNKHNTDLSRPYPGMHELLRLLRDRGIKTAVASNKYQEATEKVISHFFSDIDFSSVYGQRDGVPVKPDPTIVFQTAEAAGIAIGDALYVGDSCVDMQTGQNACIETCGVSWGFRPRAELEKYHPQHIADTAAELQACIFS